MMVTPPSFRQLNLLYECITDRYLQTYQALLYKRFSILNIKRNSDKLLGATCGSEQSPTSNWSVWDLTNVPLCFEVSFSSVLPVAQHQGIRLFQL